VHPQVAYDSELVARINLRPGTARGDLPLCVEAPGQRELTDIERRHYREQAIGNDQPCIETQPQPIEEPTRSERGEQEPRQQGCPVVRIGGILQHVEQQHAEEEQGPEAEYQP
jgi:hypothetical protein